MDTAQIDFESMRILVIDDDEFVHELITHNLRQLGVYQHDYCLSGRDAIRRIDAEEQFDVLMLDLKMPDMDGIEVLRGLAQLKFQGGILLLSAQDTRILETAKSLAKAHELNVLGALSKPVSPEELRSCLICALEQTSYQRQTDTDEIDIIELKNAIANGEIVPFYQPQLFISTGELSSLEVLARWLHPRKGIISPNVFIPLAEDAGLIDSLTRKVFRQALSDLGYWHRVKHNTFSLSINLSTESLCEIDLPEQIEDLAHINQIPCSSIVLEITEQRLIPNLVASLDVLVRLRLKGFGLSIDDFGTGYSSLEQLQKIPFTELKIDRAFVDGASTNNSSRVILESSIELAQKLKMKVVAEGVEQERDWQLLRQLDCDLAQGFLIAKPMSADDLSKWMKGYASDDIKSKEPNGNV